MNQDRPVYPDHENTDTWACAQCLEPISGPSSSPIFTADTCTCAEVAATHGFTVTPLLYHFHDTVSQDYASDYSVACPEGPERPEPTLAVPANTYLPLGPDTSLNEVEHRRSVLDPDMSYAMRRYLFESDGDQIPLHEEVTESASRFLPQVSNIESGKPTKKGRTRSQSKVSCMSMQSCGNSHGLMSVRYSNSSGDIGVGHRSGAGELYYGRADALSVRTELISDDDNDDTSYEALKNQVGDKGMKPDLSNLRPLETSTVEARSVDPGLNSTEENSYPLPRALMTRNTSEKESQMCLPSERDPNTKKPLKISIVPLTKVVVLLRRWIRKKHPRMGGAALISPEDCPIRNLESTPEQVLNTLDCPERKHSGIFTSVGKAPSIPMLDREELSSSSYADSVDSLEDESTEESEDEEWNIYSPSCEEFAAYQDFISLYRPLFHRLPDEISIGLSCKLASLLDTWLSSQSILHRPAQPSGSPPAPSNNAANSRSNQTPPVGNGQKRASTDGDGSSPPGDNSDGNRKRPRTKAELPSGSSNRGWACPYYQREPHRYCVGEWRLCAKGPGFSQVHRVKAHIYSKHAAIYCERCYTAFRSHEALLSHTRRPLGCDVRDPRPIEGLTKEQKELLKPRDRNKSEEERWNAVYKICFPNDQSIPSPFYVYYSRETAELRREIFEILQEEIPQSDSINRERLFQRVQSAFESRSSLPTGTPDSEVHALRSSSAGNDRSIHTPIHSSAPSEPLPLRQAHDHDPASMDFMPQPQPNFEDFEHMVDWNDLSGEENAIQMGLNEWLGPNMINNLPLHNDGSFCNEQCLSSHGLEQYTGTPLTSATTTNGTTHTSYEV